MSTFVFNVACPRCETAVKIFLGQSEYLCSNCTFQVVIKDQHGLLQAFKSGEVEDLDFVESSIKDPAGSMDTGLCLTFSPAHEAAGSAAEHVESSDLDEDEFGNKTANTQIIQLTFDPAQYLDRLKPDGKPVKTKGPKQKISLKKVIKYAETAKPPKPTSKEVLIRNLTIATIIILAIVFIAFFMNQ
jgi:hypothetical protein